MFYSVMLMQPSEFLTYWCLYVLWDLMLVQQQREESCVWGPWEVVWDHLVCPFTIIIFNKYSHYVKHFNSFNAWTEKTSRRCLCFSSEAEDRCSSHLCFSEVSVVRWHESGSKTCWCLDISKTLKLCIAEAPCKIRTSNHDAKRCQKPLWFI